jgi:hypothetical protein
MMLMLPYVLSFDAQGKSQRRRKMPKSAKTTFGRPKL